MYEFPSQKDVKAPSILNHMQRKSKRGDKWAVGIKRGHGWHKVALLAFYHRYW
jgi:hypothetical protein